MSPVPQFYSYSQKKVTRPSALCSTALGGLSFLDNLHASGCLQVSPSPSLSLSYLSQTAQAGCWLQKNLHGLDRAHVLMAPDIPEGSRRWSHTVYSTIKNIPCPSLCLAHHSSSGDACLVLSVPFIARPSVSPWPPSSQGEKGGRGPRKEGPRHSGFPHLHPRPTAQQCSRPPETLRTISGPDA